MYDVGKGERHWNMRDNSTVFYTTALQHEWVSPRYDVDYWGFPAQNTFTG